MAFLPRCQTGRLSIIILLSMKNFARTQKLWRVKPPAPFLSKLFAHKLGVTPVTAQLLVNRGIYTVEQGRAFLGSEIDRMYNPLLLKDMKKAVDRLLRAIKAGEKILIYGDYDADGITAAVLLVHVLRRLRSNVEYFIPHRLEEGYGLHLAVLRKSLEQGIKLVVTVDCGITALEEANWARENGLDLIITDHHEPSGELPGALAVINPKRNDCEYPYKELAGVGVALKLAQALLEAAGEENEAWQEYLDLACLGTIADIVPIQGENRILVKHGLPRLANSLNPGLRALMKVSGVKEEALGSREVSFSLAPRLNAAGRIGSPELAARLLLTENMGEACELAAELNQGNQERQKIESQVMQEALLLVEKTPELFDGSVLVLSSENWHPGVIGIVASRLMVRFYRPVLLIALNGEEGRGSARSIPDFNIYQALSHCQSLLQDYGGHAMAAGFSINSGDIGTFRTEMNRYAEHILTGIKLIPRLEIDGIVEMRQISEDLIHEINLLQPFGHNNPDPLLGCLETSVLESRLVGKGEAHLKLRLGSNKTTLDGIAFNLGAYAEMLATAETVDLVFTPGINTYKGRSSVQLMVKDLGIPAMLDCNGQEFTESSDKGYYSISGESGEDIEELFIPEFILDVLEQEKVIFDFTEKLNKEGENGQAVIDFRNTVKREDLLAELAGSGGPTLVITTCGYQTIELDNYLQLVRPGLRGKTAFCHSRMSKKARDDVYKAFEKGGVSTLFITPDLAVAAGFTVNQALLYHLPFGPDALRCACKFIKPWGKVYLMFGSDDLDDNLAGLEAMAPEREYLACLYKILRQEGSGNTDININLSRVAQVLEKSGFAFSREYSVKISLKILEDLSLISSNMVGKSARLTVYPAVSKKRELMESQTFQRLHLIKKDSAAWMKKLLKEPISNIF